MTGVALPRPIEIGFARLRIAGDDVLDFVACPVRSGLVAALQKRCDVRNLGLRDGWKSRHAFTGAAIVDHRPDLASVLVMKNQHRTDQVRAAFTAFGIRAMAEPASRDKQILPSRNCSRIRRSTDRKKLLHPLNLARAARPTSALRDRWTILHGTILRGRTLRGSILG